MDVSCFKAADTACHRSAQAEQGRAWMADSRRSESASFKPSSTYSSPRLSEWQVAQEAAADSPDMLARDRVALGNALNVDGYPWLLTRTQDKTE